MKLPSAHIVARAEDSVTLDIVIPAADEAFAGHFPRYPILPGVVQTDWAVRFAAHYLGTGLATVRDLRIKFRQPVLPDMAFCLTLTFKRATQRLSFVYAVGDIELSSGQMHLGA